jgi:uncharacterized membrane protein required for colicin V production
MKRFVIKSLELIATVAMVLIVLGAAISGAIGGGFWGFVGGLIFGGITAIVLLGTLFLLMEIADNTRRTADLLERQGQTGS